MSNNNNDEWIRNELIPMLVAQGKFSNQSKIEEKSAAIKSIVIESLNDNGETFMLTMCYRVKVILSSDDATEKIYSLVVKKTPKIEENVYDATGFDALFSNEINAYSVILSTLNMNEKCVKYYYSYRKKAEACIVLEDFSTKGWRMSKKRFNLSVEHLLLAAKQLGEFHGCGYYLKLTQPDKFKIAIDSLAESRYNKEPPQAWITLGIEAHERFKETIGTKDLSKQVPKEFLDKLAEYLSPDQYCMKVMSKPLEPIATLCHGDYLRNNIAFKYDTKDENLPIDVMMFDFQTLRYCSPMLDLCTLLLLSAGSETRSKNFEQIFKTYWNALTDKLCNNGKFVAEDLPEFLSYDYMLQEYIKYFAYGLEIATFFLMELIAPLQVPPETFINDTDQNLLLHDTRNRGGEAVNGEIRAAVLELYNLTAKYDVDIFKHFNIMRDL